MMPPCKAPPAQGAFHADRAVVLDEQLDQASQQRVQAQVISMLAGVT